MSKKTNTSAEKHISYRRAETIAGKQTKGDTACVAGDERTAATGKTNGTVILRYAPKASRVKEDTTR